MKSNCSLLEKVVVQDEGSCVWVRVGPKWMCVRDDGSVRAVCVMKGKSSTGGPVLVNRLGDAFGDHRLPIASLVWRQGLDTWRRPGLIDVYGLIGPCLSRWVISFA